MNARLGFLVKCLLFVALATLLMQYGELRPHLQLPENKLFDTLLPKIGDALLIAVFIALIVDLPAKKEMLAEILFDSSTHIIGRQLPEDVREEIRDYLNVPFIRPLWKITYVLSEAQPSAVKLQGTYEGEIRNLTTRTREYTFSAALDETWMNGVPVPELTRISILRSGKDLVKCFAKGRDFKQTVKIRPGNAHACQLLLECVEHFPQTYEYAMMNEATAQRTELTIHYPKDKFQVEVTLSSGSDGKMKKADFELHSTWTIDKPMLPGQCLFTKWKPVADAPSHFMAKPVLGEADTAESE